VWGEFDPGGVFPEAGVSEHDVSVAHREEFEARAAAAVEELNRRVESCHERVACPTCHAPVGDRCVRKGTCARPILWYGPNGWDEKMNAEEQRRLDELPRLKHPHEARIRADGIALR
jgi:hypothetical protein